MDQVNLHKMSSEPTEILMPIFVFPFSLRCPWRQIFHEIGAVEPLKHVASSTNKLASKFAAQALQIIGETVPYKLSQQVPLWTTADVCHWLEQVRDNFFSAKFPVEFFNYSCQGCM